MATGAGARRDDLGDDPGRGILAGLDPAQVEAVTTAATPLRILAGAGSGKTRVLTGRIAYRIATGHAAAPRTVAVTFTRRAAAELRSRLRRVGVDVAAGTFHGLAWAQYQQWLRDTDRPVPRIVSQPGRIVARYTEPPDVPAVVARLATDLDARARYDEEKRRRGVIDFDDVLALTTAALRDHDRWAQAVRWRFRHFYVDEFQDVNPAQFDLLDAWLGGRPDVCVVGDRNQAVYGWNGADPTLLDRLDWATVRLDANYRSSGPIVRAATAVLRASRAVAPPPTQHHGPAPTLTAFADDVAEADAVARAVRLAHAPGTAWSHIAVLARTNAQLDVVARALEAAGIPVRIPGATPAIDRVGVREAARGLAPAAPATEAAHRLRALALDHFDSAEAAALHEVADMAEEFDAVSPGASTAAFLAWLPTTRAGDAEAERQDAVCLATFHKAKGLEWRTVFLIGCQDGLVPLSRGDRDEERRLLYVAMTRAERELHLSYVGERSPFLPDDLALAAADPAPAVDGRGELARLRRVLGRLLAEAS